MDEVRGMSTHVTETPNGYIRMGELSLPKTLVPLIRWERKITQKLSRHFLEKGQVSYSYKWDAWVILKPLQICVRIEAEEGGGWSKCFDVDLTAITWLVQRGLWDAEQVYEWLVEDGAIKDEDD